MRWQLVLQEETICFKTSTKHTGIFLQGHNVLPDKKKKKKKSDTLQNIWAFASSKGIISYSFCTPFSTAVGPMTDWRSFLLFLVFPKTFTAQFSLIFSHYGQKSPLTICMSAIKLLTKTVCVRQTDFISKWDVGYFSSF